MNDRQTKLPKQFVWAVIGVSVLPSLLTLLGADFGERVISLDPQGISRLAVERPSRALQLLTQTLRAESAYTILQWSAFCIALFTVVLAFTHYFIERGVTTPIIGTALFCSGMIDAFQTLAADGFIETISNRQEFIPFTWAISRLFNVSILIGGTLPFLRRGVEDDFPKHRRGFGFIIFAGLCFIAMAYSIIFICATLQELPQAVFPAAVLPVPPRPWDAASLVLYLFAGGIVLPRFHRLHPNLFSHGLMLSVVPHIAGQAHAAFGSRTLFDSNFNIACFLKIIGYLVPLAGLILDYTRAYRVEVTLRSTEEKLRVARGVQKALLPDTPPKIAGFDMAGASHAAEAVGGDYFDYIPISNGRLGIVVADVSGHEIGASILMAQTRAYLRALLGSRDDIGSVATQLNRFLAHDVRNRWFVTMFLACLEPNSRHLEYFAAGHEAYLIDKTGCLTTFESTSIPLGMLEDTEVPSGPATTLNPGDILLLLTDGVFEAASPAAEHFGLQRVVDLVNVHREQPAREIVRAITQSVTKFRQHMPQVDDVTLVVVKCCPRG